MWCLLALLWPLVHISAYMMTVLLIEGAVASFHVDDPHSAWTLAYGGAVGLPAQEALWVAVGIAWALRVFRSDTRTTLAVLALLCALEAAAVIWTTFRTSA